MSTKRKFCACSKHECGRKFPLWAVCFVILFAGFAVNLPDKLSSQGVKNFDSWSNDIMISDLMYLQHYGLDTALQKSIAPPDLQQVYGTEIDASRLQIQVFEEGKTFPKEIFKKYDSNVTIQRFLYAFLDRVLPVNNATLLLVLKGLNCALLAGMAAAVVCWLGSITHPVFSPVATVILAALCPNFTMYRTNLYWFGGSLFVPMVVSILLVRSKVFQTAAPKKQFTLLASAAFLSCLFKQLVYFEFVSTVMVAMTIPVFYWLFAEQKSVREGLRAGVRCIGAQVAGAAGSFVVAVAIRFALQIKDYGWQRAMEISTENFMLRILGNAQTQSESILESYEAGYLEVLGKMFRATCFALGDYALSFGQLTGAVALLAVLYLVVRTWKKPQTPSRTWNAHLIITCLSLLAPLSWFVLAKPHTYVHGRHCTFVWFVPFVIVAVVFSMETIVRLLKTVCASHPEKAALSVEG